ncbi:MAG TPA: arginine decarboxylase, pyruvoyl-dependent [Thermodesulfobacteriota bacterium]|nr:arginine decarboxylase, pyruvoyl-dependent [Deltaproteobacteria bacterium]HNU70754.1 arginine decarboxylase, pyruvoyl-dependent [Thermodesulfobacteriota bacterium]HOC37802.1 arginine decarboxylase, pyruvoyl-dependent [Thermodesulfobacteriota bacterium]HQO78319.1 arginine decarboxylase, pyruvoyl-dependent [Thermodesulfobacteriota bacterium]
MVPSAVFLTKGVGFSREKLASFEQALRDAGISHLNLVEVSSILPPGCKIISKAEGIKRFKPGQITYCVLSKNQSNENRRMIAVSTGIAIPANTKDYGYLSEHHSFGQTKEEAGEYAEDLAASMLANSLGLEIDMDAAWDEKKEIYRISGKIIRTHNITQTAVCKKNGWTTVVAGAIFVFP